MPTDTNNFDYDSIPVGFYDEIAQNGSPIRRAWHVQKFDRVLQCMPSGNSVLDVGCFAGTFLSMVPEHKFSRQEGVDILPKQVAYAQNKFGTKFRRFQHIKKFSDLSIANPPFDCMTLIEVIEHLTDEQVYEMFVAAKNAVKPGGKLIISTPNYSSAWPVLEVLVNRLSEVSYEEQHLNKFNYFQVERQLKDLYPTIFDEFTLDYKTTTHFISPFLAAASYQFSTQVSRMLPHRRWHFPFGNLVLLRFTRSHSK